ACGHGCCGGGRGAGGGGAGGRGGCVWGTRPPAARGGVGGGFRMAVEPAGTSGGLSRAAAMRPVVYGSFPKLPEAGRADDVVVGAGGVGDAPTHRRSCRG